ncbi:MAG TPA: carboxypeptidase-like regulatory domain-containing protein [Thermoanaerobaculia bacterium]|nr:carboxypeptidase-like regulatory domain-containing protein [Thermoanaerobaculia bacterium]
MRLTSVEVRTGADGRCSLDNVPDGAQKLVANAAGYAPELRAFTAANGVPSELELALTRGTPVQVRFVDAGSGQPLAGYAMIGDTAGMLIIAGGAVPADGMGLQLQLAAGKYELHAMAQGYARKSATLTVPGPPLTLALERAP